MLRSRAAILLVLAVLVSACSISEQPPIAPSHFKTAQTAFRILIEIDVNKPGSPQLMNAALDAVQAQLVKDGAPVPTIAHPEFTGNPESDFAKFSASLDTVIATNPAEDATKLEHVATEGMASTLKECHTYFLDPDRAKGFNAPPQQYSGIGASLSVASSDHLVEIVQVFPGSPAEKAGVKKGDLIFKVNGEDVANFTSEEVANRVRGTEGTTVNLVLIRNGVELPLAIVRGRVTAPRVLDQTDDGGVGYIAVSQLNGDVANQVAAAVKRQNDAGVIGRVLDLRDDPGGDLSAAIDIASIFIKRAVLIYQVGRDGQRDAIRTNDDLYIANPKPLVVLVNKNSASGSEIIAAAVRANGVGTVMGDRTFGCVGSSSPRQLPDGSLLLVTVTVMQDAKTGEELNGTDRGIVPDRSVPLEAGRPDTQLAAAETYIKSGGKN